MKKQHKKDSLPLAMILLGAIGCALRSVLYAVAVDDKNLLVSNHPLEWLLWLCTAAAGAVIVLCLRKDKKYSRFEGVFRTSLTAALGHILAGCGILVMVLLTETVRVSMLKNVLYPLGTLTGAILILTGFLRLWGRPPFFPCYVVCSVFFAVQLVSNYQIWCAEPQMQNYFFAFSGMIALMLFSYAQAALCAGNGNSIFQRAAGGMAIYCCLTALSRSQHPYLYLCCAIWAATGLFTPRSPGKKKAGNEHVPS